MVPAHATGLNFVQAEDSLSRLALSVIEPFDDELRMQKAAMFSDYLMQVLSEDDSFRWPFDSLKTVSRLMAPDSSFRIMTWYVPLSRQRFRYFGVVQRPPSADPPHLISLNDQSDTIAHPLLAAHSAESWFGAWYYELIQVNAQDESGMQSQYILLGWKGDNEQTRLRLIEPFAMTADGPVFGAQVFYEARGNPFRVVFEYSARASMNLRYEGLQADHNGVQRPLIVFDRLVPMSEIMRGQREFYIPDGERVDALIFKNSHWHFVPDYDVSLLVPR